MSATQLASHPSSSSSLLPAIQKSKKSSKSSSSSKSDKNKTLNLALRFEVQLDLAKNNCNIISFSELARENQKLNKSNKLYGEENDDHEDDADVARIAARMEQKYGSGSLYEADGYIDKGEGYDENDSFIDNAEAYDELIPADLTTELEGFYINNGELKFKPIDNNGQPPDTNQEVDDAYEKANILQKLKRKRNKFEDGDSNSNEPKIVNKKLTVKNDPKMSAPNNKTAKQYQKHDHQPQPQHLNSRKKSDDVPVLMIDPKKNRTSSTNDQAKAMMKQLKKQQSMDNMFKRNNNSALNLTGNDMVTNVASLTQNLITQMITQNLNDSLSASSSNQQVQSSSSNYQNSSYCILKQNLLNAKVPYEIVNLLPMGKPNANDGKSGLSHEWNRFLVDVYKKTSNAAKVRQKIFIYLATYLGVNGDSLLNYTQKIIVDPFEVRKYSKPGLSAPLNTEKFPHQKQQSSLTKSSTTGMSGTSSSKMTKSSSAAGQQAMNLSTNQSYSEGLAGKLIHSESGANSSIYQTSSNKATNLTTNKLKNNSGSGTEFVVNSTGGNLNMNSNLTNYAMLQSLASLASSTPSSASSSLKNTQPMSSMSAPSITSATSRAHPNSLLASMKANPNSGSQQKNLTPAAAASLLAGSCVPSSSSINSNTSPTANTTSTAAAASNNSTSPSSQRNANNDLLHNLFQNLPNLFSNSNLINHFLSTSQPQPTSSISGGTVSNASSSSGGGRSGTRNSPNSSLISTTATTQSASTINNKANANSSGTVVSSNSKNYTPTPTIYPNSTLNQSSANYGGRNQNNNGAKQASFASSLNSPASLIARSQSSTNNNSHINQMQQAKPR